jgi:hypothetical protein
MKIVECPLCHTKIKVYERQKYFRHCGLLFDIKSYVIAQGVTYTNFEAKKPKTEDSNNENAPGGEFLEIEIGDDGDE